MAENPKPAENRPVESEAQRVSRALAESSVEAEKRQMDETVPGGRYKNSVGQMVDAEGKLLEEKKAD